MCPHSVTVKRKSIWLQWAIIGYNRDEADSQERLRDLWTGNVCCSSQHFTANIFSVRAAWLPQDNVHWCLTSFTQDSFASAWTETAVRCWWGGNETSLLYRSWCTFISLNKILFHSFKISSIRLVGWTRSSLSSLTDQFSPFYLRKYFSLFRTHKLALAPWLNRCFFPFIFRRCGPSLTSSVPQPLTTLPSLVVSHLSASLKDPSFYFFF